MTPAALSALAEAAEALYQIEVGQLQSILSEEARLRRELADLKQNQRRNARLPEDVLAGPRAVGADMVWQGWVGRMRIDLNQQLARVLVCKDAQMGTLRRAFGKAEATRGLLTKDKARRQKARQSDEMQKAQDLMLLRTQAQTS